MADIEFVDEDSDGFAGGDELVPQPRRPIPRWAAGAAITVLAAGFVAAVAAQGDDGRPRATPTSSAAPTPSPSPSPSPGSTDGVIRDPLGLGPDLDLGASAETVLGVAAAGTSTWVLRRSVLSELTPHLTLTSAMPSGTGEIVGAQLLLDAGADLAWAVFGTGFATRIVVFTASTLAPQGTISYRGAVHGAAALDGRLYFSVGDRIVEVSRGGQTRVVSRPRPGVALDQLVADPSRHRLLVVGLAALDYERSRLWAVDLPSGKVGVRRVPDDSEVTLAVAGSGAIWLAGRDGGDGVLMALDPGTLRPTVHSPLDPILAPRASLTAAGHDVVWVRDGTGPVLRCIDASTGNQLQTWSIDGPVASASRAAALGYGTRAVTLALRSCTG